MRDSICMTPSASIFWTACGLLFAACSTGHALQAADPIKINEVHYDPLGAPAPANEFVELYNAGPDTLYLDGAVITDEGNAGTNEATFRFPGTPGGTSIPLAPGGFMMLVPDATGTPYPSVAFEFYAGAGDLDDPSVPNITKTSGLANNLSLANGGDGLTLSTGVSTGNVIPCAEVVDGVSWETGGGDTTAQSNTVCADPAPDAGVGTGAFSLQRKPDGADTDNSAADLFPDLMSPGICNGCPATFVAVSVSPCPPPPAAGVFLFANLEQGAAPVTTVNAWYRVKPDSTFHPVDAFGEENFYFAPLPGQPDQSVVEYFMIAADARGNSALYPVGAPAVLASYRVGMNTIQQVQAVTLSDSCVTSAWVGLPVNVAGVVTHEAYEFAADSFFLQSGTAPNSGVRAQLVDPSFQPNIGDSVLVSGIVREVNCQTEILAECVSVVAPNRPVVARTLDSLDVLDMEPYEGMLVHVPGDLPVHTDWVYSEVNGEQRKEFLIGSPPFWVGDDTYEPDGIGPFVVLPNRVAINGVTGIVSYRLPTVMDTSTRLRIEPRRDPDVGLDLTSIGPGGSGFTPRPAVEGSWPNPFNPHTTLSLRLPEPGFATLRIYDVAGREVRTLLARHVDTTELQVGWDGRDDLGGILPAGTYIARLDVAGNSASRKLVLVR